MGNQRTDTDSVINLVINGRQAMASYKEITDAQRKLNAEVRNMKPNDPGYAKKAAELRELNTAVRDQRLALNAVNKETESLADKWGRIAEVAGGNFLSDMFQNVLSGLQSFASGSEAAFAESEKGQAQLQAVLKSTAGVAGQTKEHLDALAQTTMNLTTVDDDVITKSESLLLTFTNVRGAIYDKAIPAIVDMTAALNNGDVSMGAIQKSTLQVGKALNDPIKGMTALRKVGVSFTEDQIKTVKALVATNDTAAAQKIILDELAKEFGGVSQAMARTDTGIKEGFQTRLDNIKEALGGFITKMKVATIEGLLPFLTKVERWVSIPVAEKLQEEQGELNGLVNALLITNDNQEVRNSLIATLQAKYPDFLGKINAESASNELLARRIAEVNDQYRQRIFIAVNEDKIRIITEKRNDAIREETAARTTVAKASGLSATELAKLTDQEIRQMAQDQRNKALQADRVRVGGNAYSAGTSNTRNQEAENLDLILNGRKRIAASFKEEADLMGANKIMEQKIHDQRVKDIDAEIAKLKLLKTENAKAEIARLTAEKNGLLGIAPPQQKYTSAGPSKKEISDRDKALKEFESLGQDYKNLELARVTDMMAVHKKEIEQEGQKYDALIKKEQDFLKQKGVTTAQRTATQTKIDKIQADKKIAQDAIGVRQEKEMLEEISSLRERIGVLHGNELDKERLLINKFYDEQEADFKGNEEALSTLKLAREKELSAAELREKKRLEDEKRRIESESGTLSGDNQAMKLAKINKQYDDELAALKSKFSKEALATQEGLAAIAAIEENRGAAIKGVTTGTDDKEDKKYKDAAIMAAQALSDATFTIAANNRKRETDIKLSALDRERQAELSNKKLSDKQKDEINAKYDKKVKEEKLKAWQADQRAAVGQALINGALAVTKALPNIPLAIATGIAAAAQVAVIVAQKAPEFGVGVRDFEGGKAIVGEKGPEIIDENGKVWLADQPMLADLEKGTNVYTAGDTSKMMKGKTLGEKLYSSPSYSIDQASVRTAERNYRSSGASSGYTSTSTAASQAPSRASSGSDIDELKQMVRDLADMQRAESQKEVAFNYQKYEEFAENLKQVRIAQKG